MQRLDPLPKQERQRLLTSVVASGRIGTQLELMTALERAGARSPRRRCRGTFASSASRRCATRSGSLVTRYRRGRRAATRGTRSSRCCPSSVAVRRCAEPRHRPLRARDRAGRRARARPARGRPGARDARRRRHVPRRRTGAARGPGDCARAPSRNIVDRYISVMYLPANAGRSSYRRPPTSSSGCWARGPHGVRRQGHRRPVDSLLLGRELRPDLPGAAPARGARASSPEGSRRPRPQAQGVRAHRGRPKRARERMGRRAGADAGAARRSLLKLFFADTAHARAGARADPHAPRRARGVPRVAPADRGGAGGRPAVHQPRPPVRHRLRGVQHRWCKRQERRLGEKEAA